MDSNDDFYGKELNLNCFYMHTNFGQKYLKTAIVILHRFFSNENPLLPDHNNGVKPENRLCNVHRWWIQDIFGLLASILLKGLQILDRLYCRGWDGHLGYVQQLQLHLPHQLTTWKIKFWNRNYRMKFNGWDFFQKE